jgi:hypothetical protein
MTKHLGNDQEIEFQEIKIGVIQEIQNFDQEIESFFQEIKIIVSFQEIESLKIF